MAVGIEEVDRLEHAVVCRTDHLQPARLGSGLGGQQAVVITHLEGDVLHPGRRRLVAAHLGLVGQLEEGKHVAAARIQEHVHVGIVGAGRGYFVLRDGKLELHAQHVAVEFHGLLGVLAPIGDVVNATEDGRAIGEAHGVAPCCFTRRRGE